MEQNLDDEILLKAAQQFDTPLFVYHADKIIEQCHAIQQAFKGFNNRVFYAAKALTNPHILKLIHRQGLGVDCSSINEAKIAIACGIPPGDILYTSNSISFQEIEEAVSLGVHINVDSLSAMKKFGQKFGGTYPLGLRIRPNIMAGGHLKISTGHVESKFGIGIEKRDRLVEIMEQYNMRISCLHIHTGSEVEDAEVFVSSINLLLKWLPFFPDLKQIDLGGGFKVAYEPGKKVTDMFLLGQLLERKIKTCTDERIRNMEIWFEPGKFIVSESGYLLTRVNVLKSSGQLKFAGVDSGFHHLIRPMFYDAYHHIRNISNPGGEKSAYNIVGQICETDNFAWQRPVAEICEDDVLAIFNAGAYGMVMASNYNSRFRPAEVLVSNGQLKLIRRRETMEDILSTVVPFDSQ